MNEALLVIPDVVIDRLRRYFKPDAVGRILNSPAPLFADKSPMEFVREGHAWEEVLFAYDRLFSYAITA